MGIGLRLFQLLHGNVQLVCIFFQLFLIHPHGHAYPRFQKGIFGALDDHVFFFQYPDSGLHDLLLGDHASKVDRAFQFIDRWRGLRAFVGTAEHVTDSGSNCHGEIPAIDCFG